jgi:hypothetical protein
VRLDKSLGRLWAILAAVALGFARTSAFADHAVDGHDGNFPVGERQHQNLDATNKPTNATQTLIGIATAEPANHARPNGPVAGNYFSQTRNNPP